MSYEAVRWSCITGLPRVIKVEFDTRTHPNLDGKWLHVVKGGITGFESARISSLMDMHNYIFDKWVACGGTWMRWDKLEIPLSEIRRFLKENNIEV